MTSYSVRLEEREMGALFDSLQEELGRLRGGSGNNITIESEHFEAKITIRRKRREA